MTVVFVGSLPSHMLGVVSFKSFGQRAEVTEEQARDLALGGSAILPVLDFEEAGFTPDELKKYSAFGSHSEAPIQFQEKKRHAVTAAIAFADAFRAQQEEEAQRG